MIALPSHVLSWETNISPSFLCVCVCVLFRAEPAAYGSSQARGQSTTAAAGLQHSYGKEGSELSLPPTPQLMATQDP